MDPLDLRMKFRSAWDHSCGSDLRTRKPKQGGSNSDVGRWEGENKEHKKTNKTTRAEFIAQKNFRAYMEKISLFWFLSGSYR